MRPRRRPKRSSASADPDSGGGAAVANMIAAVSSGRSPEESHPGRGRAMHNVILTAAIAGLGGLLFGYDTGVIASALLFIEPDFGLSSFGSGLVVAAVPIGAVVGAAFAGRLSDQYGRRILIIGSAVVFIVGALGSAAAGGEPVLVISRVIVGIAIGLASATAPVYICAVYDEQGGYTGQNPPPAGTPIGMYSKDAKSPPAPVTPGPKTVLKMTFSDAKRFGK